LPTYRGEGRLVAFKWQKPQKRDKNGTERGLEGAQAYRENSKNAIFQNPNQRNSFSESFTWAEAVRKNLPAELFIYPQ
jgi:hypothetical protein